jgi:hypothetical protein
MNASIGSPAARAESLPMRSTRLGWGGRRTWIALAAILLVGGAALSWSWLVAAGIAPLLLTLAPCAAMCALGLCMNGSNAGKYQDTEATPAQLTSGGHDGVEQG